jgi:hypothetical protein
MYAKYISCYAIIIVTNGVGMGVWFSTILADIHRILISFLTRPLWISLCQTLVGCAIVVQSSP